MAVATTTIVLYNPTEKLIISEVYEGEQYWHPTEVKRYDGTLEDFVTEYPDYEIPTEIIEVI